VAAPISLGVIALRAETRISEYRPIIGLGFGV